MNSTEKRKDIIEVGRELLNTGLVARTWGNISARKDGNSFLITPSGLDYMTMTDSDIVEVNIETGEWTGDNRPSGERGVHKAAYQVFPDVNFVVHTHQNFATAMGLAGFENLDISEAEKDRLGGVALAEYGLPGTDKLTNAVAGALKSGAHIVLMIHHGVLICGQDRQDAMERTLLLEEVCRRNVVKHLNSLNTECSALIEDAYPDEIKMVLRAYAHAAVVNTPELIEVSKRYATIKSQLDDVSQMVGAEVRRTELSELENVLKDTNAVLVNNFGAIVVADNDDDVEALSVLMQKMAIVKLYTEALNTVAEINTDESIFMHEDYVNRYSKQKK